MKNHGIKYTLASAAALLMVARPWPESLWSNRASG